MAPPCASRAHLIVLVALTVSSMAMGSMQDLCAIGKVAFVPEPGNSADALNGVSWPPLCIHNHTEKAIHFFAIGDWGGLGEDSRTFDGRKNKRAFVKGRDDFAQVNVARAMKKIAAVTEPEFIVNVGDNFYPAGYGSKCCDTDMCSIVNTGQWWYNFEQVYDDALASVPWHGVLGNHDYGGWQFNMGWDQSIVYTWHSDRWLTPAMYWERRVQHANMSADFFFLDTNINDVDNPNLNGGHNICGNLHNRIVGLEADCSSCGGPADPLHCVEWFSKHFQDQMQWLEARLEESDADWQIIVTHFPPQWVPRGYPRNMWTTLAWKYGIDVFIAGHRHQQEVHYKDHSIPHMGETAWLVTGGGGGITSEADPRTANKYVQQYGFLDIAISKHELVVDMYDDTARKWSSTHISPRQRAGYQNPSQIRRLRRKSDQDPPHSVRPLLATCEKVGCHAGFDSKRACQCSSKCEAFKNCCSDYAALCTATARCSQIGCEVQFDPGKRCQCNARCEQFNNCCDDYKQTCKLTDVEPKDHRPIANDREEDPPKSFKRRAARLSCENRRRSAMAVLSASARLAHENEVEAEASRNKELPLVFAMQMDLKAATRLEDSEPGQIIQTTHTSADVIIGNMDVSGSDCFRACHEKAGLCEDWCGAGLACCLHDDPSAPYECRNVYQFNSKGYECVTPLVSPSILHHPWVILIFLAVSLATILLGVFCDVSWTQHVKCKLCRNPQAPLIALDDSVPRVNSRCILLTSRTVVADESCIVAAQCSTKSATPVHEAN